MIPSESLKRFNDYSQYEKEFDRFYQSHEKIVLYGAGKFSSILTEYFQQRKLKFEFYCVTKRRTDPLPNVKEFDEIADIIDDSYGIIIAMGPEMGGFVAESLRSRYGLDNVFCSWGFYRYCQLWKSLQYCDKVVFENDFIKSIGIYTLREDTFYILCSAHIGETVYTASLVKAFKEQNGVDRVCLIVKNAHGGIPDFFPSVDEKLVSDELVEICKSFSMFNEIYKCRNYSFDFLEQKSIFTPPKKHILSRRKTNLDLDENSELEKMELKNTFPGFPRKTALLMPHAHSIARLSRSFWVLLAKALTEKGYEVYTNIADETEYIIEGTQALSRPLADMPGLAEKCSLVIALRSGLCDLLAFTKAKMIVIHSNDESYEYAHFDADNIKDIVLNPQREDEKNLMTVLDNADLGKITI